MSRMQTNTVLTAMNQLSNHDHSRFLTRTNHMAGRVDQLGYEAAEIYTKPAIMREAVVMQTDRGWARRRSIMVMRPEYTASQIRITGERTRGAMKTRN